MLVLKRRKNRRVFMQKTDMKSLNPRATDMKSPPFISINRLISECYYPKHAKSPVASTKDWLMPSHRKET